MRMAINTPEDSTVNERFIKLVEETPILWNLHMPMYRNREMKEQSGPKSGRPFNLSGSEAYKVCCPPGKYKREQKLRDSKGLSQTECWRLYDKFKFLDTQRQHGSFPMAFWRGNNFVSMIKSEFPEIQSNSTATSPSYHMSGEPSENESNGGEPFQDNSEYFNDSMTHGGTSEGRRAEFGERSENLRMLLRNRKVVRRRSNSFEPTELKTNAILMQHRDRRKDSWARCETLGHRVAQTMFALEENDPDLALRFDIIMSEAITSIKKDQLQRLMARQQQGEEHRRQMELQMRLQQQQSDRTGPALVEEPKVKML
ncbi:hypothetical protein quinque_015976 [Culex quinquefasciatus]